MKYILHDLNGANLARFSKQQLARIKLKLHSNWFKNIIYKKIVSLLVQEVEEDFLLAMKTAVVNYVLMDVDERKRVGISVIPSPFPRSVIRGPVPWHQQFLIAQQFCRHNLFILNPIIQRLRVLWQKRYMPLRFVHPDLLRTSRGEPLSPTDLQKRVFEQCQDARNVLLKRWLPEVAFTFVTLRKSWTDLIPARRSESLLQVKRFFNCVSALMSIQLRSMTLLSLESFLQFMETYAAGNAFQLGVYDEMAHIIMPMLNLKLQPAHQSVEFQPSLDRTHEIISRCLQEIVMATKEFPRVEQELFPEMKGRSMFLLSVNWEEDKVQALYRRAMEILDRNIIGPKSYVHIYDKYEALLSGQALKDRDQFLAAQASLTDFRQKMDGYMQLKREILAIRNSALLNLFILDCHELNQSMVNLCEELYESLIRDQVDTNRLWNRTICNEFDEMATKLGDIPEETKALVELQRYLKLSMMESLPELMGRIHIATQRVLFLLDCTILSPEDIQLNTRVFQWPKDMSSVFELAKTRTGHKRDQVEEDLRKRIDEFELILQRLNQDLEAFMKKDPPVLTLDEMKSSVNIIDKLEARMQEAVESLRWINREETFLDWDPSKYALLEKMQMLVDLFSSLWHVALDFHEKYERWYNGPLEGLVSGDIQTLVETMYEKASNLSRTLGEYPAARRIADTIKSKIEKFRIHLPILHTLCNPGLRERHWYLIGQAIGFQIKRTAETSLADMIEAGLGKIMSQLEEIGATASKEYALEMSMAKMKSEWQSVIFECVPYRESGVSILSGVEDVQQMLDDHILKAQTMHSSAYIKPFEEEMREWEEKLISMQDILDAWLRCQESWLYLEPIFNSEDIMKQMPTEGRKFNKVDRIWRNIMAKTVADPRVLQATSQPNMLPNLSEANELLDAIMKGLNDYLEKKRLFFPRFFFLSNDELLEILSETKDPLRVQPHVRKCFEGIDHLKFEADKFGNQDIVGMVSKDGEEVEFCSMVFPSDAKGMVEKWLLQVEKQMIASLKDVISRSTRSYLEDVRTEDDFTRWVLEWPGQAILTSHSISWTSRASEAIKQGTLITFLEECSNQLSSIVKLVQNGLSACARKTIRALIVLGVHARDVLEQLIQDGVANVDDFSWTSQMRYYLSDYEEGIVRVKMVSTTLRYAFEYLGNMDRLVITPLTLRCFRTLMNAIMMNLGGAPEGPAGSGKTETCKDLAKAIAKPCVVFNCSDGIDYHGMGKFLKGLAQSGSWACFDEFNRIDMDVLSVVAQQIHTIQSAIASQAKMFTFEGVELSLNPTCCIFITMNPSCDSSHPIPDNLKLLFRPVAMMIPDSKMIAEVSLYSMGFLHARALARKIVQVYRLCSEQLSYQAHYEYGMRAVKAVLETSAHFRVVRPDLDDEFQVVLKAIMDVNLPKFVSEDIPLFESIVKDLFHDVAPPVLDRTLLKETVKSKCKDFGLQATPWFIGKVLQLYEMVLVRHGIMIIGEPMSCKSETYHILAEALSELSTAGDTIESERAHEYRTTYKIINPKSVTMNQLYGVFDNSTHEWTDGVLGRIYREMATAGPGERKWLVFDGPVDSVWIENLNTVLDDSKKLCLMNGEIIPLSPWMNLIFEMSDLRRASPAVVGRSGILFMESRLLGWRPLKQSFIETLSPTHFDDEKLVCLDDMFEWLVPPCLEQIRDSNLFLPFSELHLIKCQLSLLKSLLGVPTSTNSTEMKANDEMGGDSSEVDATHMQMAFLFSILWGLCSTMADTSKPKFDAYFRNLVDGLVKGNAKPLSFRLGRTNLIPDHSSVFNYTLDVDKPGCWVKWVDQVAPGQFVGDDEVLIVPTAETVKQSFFLELALAQEMPLAILGHTGTGKSFITNSFIRRLPKEKFITNVINFSARTSVNYTQDVIMSKLDRRRKGVFGPAMGKKCVIFVDDLNLPQMDESDTIPPVELLRQWIDHGYWYERKDSSKMEILDTLLLTAVSPPGSGRNEISPRFLRHMNILSVDQFHDDTLRRIFSTVVTWHFKSGFEMAIHQMNQSVVDASLKIYKSVITTFLPTPSKCHYMFNLRDFSKVIDGVRSIPSSHLRDPNKLIRLWCHEVYRVFYDRLIDDEDRKMFFTMVKRNCSSEFKVDLAKILFPHVMAGSSVATDEHLHSICFGDYMHPEVDKKVYDEIPDSTLLAKAMEHYLHEYNTVSKAPMPLVMFRYAVEHTSRINRIIRNKGGHALLVGLGGSGRQSLTRLATFIAGLELFQIEVNKSYGITNWRADLKRVLRKAGADSRQVVFLFTDLQIKDEAFLEDISMVLNTGEVPNLFAPEEKAEILERIQSSRPEASRDLGGDGSFANLYNIFLQNVKRNLHIVLCMSPIGPAFRNRLRMFPSLINCCSIDWFPEWPVDALEKVAGKFLEEMDLDEESRENCVQMCANFHQSASLLSQKFLKELKRYNYVTPTSYLALINTFKILLKSKQKEILNLKNRYEMGLGKLEFASSQVSAMQNELTALRPQLLETSDETEKLMIKIEQDTIQVEAKKEIVACDEALANEAAAAAQAIRDDCENDLAEAIPALQSAVHALNTLNPSDITVVKTMKNPAPIVKFVVEAVCVMKGVPAERKPDPDNQGKLIDDFWVPGQKMMGDIKFLDTLRAYDKDNIPPIIMKRIREKYVNNPYFDPNLVRKVSTACEGLCKWVRAIEVYDRVIKIVSPKKAKLAEAETELARQMDKLNEKRAQLQQVTDKLQALNDEFAAMTKKKKDLEDNIELCSQKLDRAEKLIQGLGGERDRWREMAAQLGERLLNITGDVLLSAGTVAYLGAFDSVYRLKIIDEWRSKCQEEGIKCSPDFSLTNTLGDPVEIRQWQIAGLPKDYFSVDNGVIVANARRWPLMIDPQGQASKWIKNMEKENRLLVIKYTDPDYLTMLQEAIEKGYPALLENVSNELDPGLETILLRQTFVHNGVDCVLLGDAIVEYNHDFKLYIVTDLKNPHFPPEVSVKVTLMNFMITPEGLQDQLLGILAAVEKPELEEKKNQLILEGAKNNKQLKDIEDKILKVLSASQGNILEDETAIQILSSSKVLSEEIAAKQRIASETESEIDTTRDGYRPVAIHASILFFCISELSNIDPMYQFSLPWFVNLYHKSIQRCVRREKMEERIQDLTHHFTTIIYQNISRSLFHEHILVFSLILCVGILQGRGEISAKVWSFLLNGGDHTNPTQQPNPAPTWLSDKSWNEIVRASLQLPTFQGLMDHFKLKTTEWRQALFEAPNSFHAKLPDVWDKLKELERLVLLRFFRPDMLIFAVRDFIVKKIGSDFIQAPSLDLEKSFSESTHETPIILMLSSGVDPLSAIYGFKPPKPHEPKFITTLSLGQGQGPLAHRAIVQAAESGGWVILQNCHLAEHWMSLLANLWEEEITSVRPGSVNVHKSFRLWLTSYSTLSFPSSLLQIGVKISLESPKGLKANLELAYLSEPIKDERFYRLDEAPQFRQQFRRLLFSLAFFHGVVLERLQYESVGWNTPYGFNKSDLTISLKQLQNTLQKHQPREENTNQRSLPPLKALLYLTSECNYGGRVTDPLDRRLLNALLHHFFNENVAEARGYLLSENGVYKVPTELSHSHCLEFISDGLPTITIPEGLGLNDNAAIIKNTRDSYKLLKGVLTAQPHLDPMSHADEGLASSALLNHVKTMRAALPTNFDSEAINASFPVVYENSLNMVLRLETTRYNMLLDRIRNSLELVEQALTGEILMSVDIERVFESLIRDHIPNQWLQVSYPSLRSLNGYMKDLQDRIGFFRDWIAQGPWPLKEAPSKDSNKGTDSPMHQKESKDELSSPCLSKKQYWLSGFFFPQSLLTAVLQNFARSQSLTMDQVDCEFIPLTPREILQGDQLLESIRKRNPAPETPASVQNSVVLKGIFLQGASWDLEAGVLKEATHKVHSELLPPILFRPILKHSQKELENETGEAGFVYECPIYRNEERQGRILSTGHSTNYVFTLNLQSKNPPEHWIRRGLAGILQLTDP
ncbi:dynein axonemal heavy chain 3-like [Tigriopus californicus]|uniref:dynein axonemal heavy chain 3-like n=1 Tax=Tigriopus californicus TaxID=6832 RepID=UPI0027D9EDD2|nr:dynein axonemal heavy chain 3-like [Tigriopus californicus]